MDYKYSKKTYKSMISDVQFSIWTADEIKQESVVEVTEKKTFDGGEIVENGLRDERMGPLKGRCKTCGETRRKCNGHFGHITLYQPVYHVSWVTNLIYWLRCTCRECKEFIIKDLKAPRIQKNKYLQWYSKHVYTRCPKCSAKQPKYSWNRERGYIEKNKVVYPIQEVKEHLESIDSKVIHKLKMSHPKDMILTVLPVPPPNVRPAIMQGSVVRGEDDLTYRLIQIMRSNSKLKKSVIDGRPEHILAGNHEHLQNAVTGYINHTKLGNSKGISSKREYTSLEARLKSKEGRVRGNLMGKRCDFTARTVITGDDTLGMHEVGIPISVAEKLTIPIKVTAYNKSSIQSLLVDPKSRVKFVIRPNGSRVDLSFVNRNNINLEVGWSVERSLVDGDIVLFNRQPSLHKMSIMAHEVRILPYSTFRMNLSCTTPYNADFDGDEMNVHVPQTLQSQAEARNIMAVKYQMVSPQSNRPVMSVIQDTMAGSYLLSADTVTLSRYEMMHCVYQMPGWDGVFKEQEVYTGKDLLSQCLPMVNWSKGDVLIRKGVLVSGRLTKKVLGTSNGSLIHVIYNDCGPDETILFINRLQRIVHCFLRIRGFSVGIDDMLPMVSVQQEITNAFKDIEENCNTENQINQRLNICRDTMGTMVQKPLDDSNRLYTMVRCGSKGSNINISQIMAVVGQQNLCGARIPNTWTDRTLPHFKKGSDGPKERGFITHSYVEGLSPHEVWMHAISGREGLIDTAIKTSQTGYIQRRFMKALENITVRWGGSARNSDGSIVQFKYGDDGFDSMRIENQYLEIWDKPGNYPEGKEDHDFLHEINTWRDNGSKDTAWFQLPIPVDRIILNAKTLFSFPSSKITREKAEELIKKLMEEIDNRMVRILIRSKLTLERVVKEEFTIDELENIIHGIKTEWHRTKATPGESVGAVAAQSIGEPATQMTLNTFHFAGVSSMNVTLGIPRLEELINCTKSQNMKTPLSIIQTDDPDKVIKQIRHVVFEDLVDRISITMTPKAKEVEFFHMFPDPEYTAHVPERETLVLYLKEWYDMVSIISVLDQTKLSIAYTDGPKAIFHMQLKNDNDIGLYYEQNMKQLSIRGIPGAETTIKVKSPGSKKYHVETTLSDVRKIMDIDSIIHNTINTNDIHRVREIYGIEAARNTLIREIRQILSYYGIYVNVRHITLAVDWMTWIGTLTPLTRHGIRRIDASPIKRATFEEVGEVFHQAACAMEHDALDGISECIITGTPPKMGSNHDEVILDKVVEKEFAIPFPKEAVWEGQAWGQDDEEDIYGTKEVEDPWADQREVWERPPMLLPGMPNPQFAPQFGIPNPQFGIPNPQPPQFGMPNPQFVPPQFGVPNPTIAYSPVSPAYDPNSPTSPAYDPGSPMSPAYDPNSPMSPAYDPGSPMSPAYDPGSPMSPAYDPNSPMSPAYSPTSPGYDPQTPPGSPGVSHEAYFPSVQQPVNKRRRTYC